MNTSNLIADLWGFDLERKPTRSSYFWYAILLCFVALLGFYDLAIKVSQNHQLFVRASPILLVGPILIGWFAVLTIRVVRAARSQAETASESVQRKAARYFSTYVGITGILAATALLMSSFQ